MARLVFLALFLAIFIPLGFAVHWLVYEAMPTQAATHLGVGLFSFSAGFLLGQRHGLVR